MLHKATQQTSMEHDGQVCGLEEPSRRTILPWKGHARNEATKGGQAQGREKERRVEQSSEQMGSGKHTTQRSVIGHMGQRGRVGWPGLPALLMAAVLLGLGIMPAQAAPLAYITNNASNTVSVIDTATNTVVATVPVGDHPVGVAVNLAGTRAYVTNASANTVSVIDTATNTVVATVPVGGHGAAVAVNLDGTRAYVTHAADNTVSVIDTATNTVVATVAVGAFAGGVAVHPDGGRVYVTNLNTSTVSVIDTATNTVVATVAVGTQPFGVAVHPAGTRAYVVHSAGNTVSVIDTASNTVVATVPVGTNGQPGVAVHPAGTFVYVTHSDGNSVSVLNTATNTVVATVPVGTHPLGVAVHPTGTRVYVANRFSNSVSVLNTATNTVVATVAVGSQPHALGQFIVPAAPVPELILTLTGCTTCRTGDRLKVQAHVTNARPATPVEVKIGVRFPTDAPLNLFGKHQEFTLSAGLDLDVPTPVINVVLPAGLPTGTWHVEGALLEPELGVTLSRDVKSFEVVP